MVPFMKAVEGLRDYFKDTFGLRLNPWPIFGLGVTLLLIAFASGSFSSILKINLSGVFSGWF